MSGFLVPINMPGCQIFIQLSDEDRNNAITGLTTKLKQVAKEVNKAGEQLDRLTDGTPDKVRSEKLDRYLTAIEQFCDARDTLKRIGVVIEGEAPCPT